MDTSNEIGGDGDVPHKAVGSCRRLQVRQTDNQHEVMIEAVEVGPYPRQTRESSFSSLAFDLRPIGSMQRLRPTAQLRKEFAVVVSSLSAEGMNLSDRATMQ